MTASTPDDLYEVLEQFLVRLLNMGESETMDALIEMDLSFSQARTLFVLAQHCEPVAITEVARALRMSLASTGRNVDQLVTQDLVERREDRTTVGSGSSRCPSPDGHSRENIWTPSGRD